MINRKVFCESGPGLPQCMQDNNTNLTAQTQHWPGMPLPTRIFLVSYFNTSRQNAAIAEISGPNLNDWTQHHNMTWNSAQNMHKLQTSSTKLAVDISRWQAGRRMPPLGGECLRWASMQAGMHRWMNRPKAYCLGSPWHWHNKVMIEHMLNENTWKQQK